MRGFRVIKDLLVDMDAFLAKYRRVSLTSYHTPEPEKERLQTPEERERFDDTTKCILCGACTTSCPSFLGEPGLRWPRRHRERAPLHFR